MELLEKIRIAKKVIDKRMDFEELYYCDDLYGHEDDADEIWELVEEHTEIGRVEFNKKYAGRPPYPG